MDALSKPSSSDVPGADQWAQEIQTILAQLRTTLLEAQATYKHYADRARRPAPAYAVGDSVYLNRKNIKTNCPCRSLDDKNLGPFRILEQISPVAFCLKLPSTMTKTGLHNVFHVSLFRPVEKNPYQQPKPRPSPVVVDGAPEYEVEVILDSKQSRWKNGTPRGGVKYLVRWKGYSHAEDSWLPLANLKNSPRLLSQFHAAYPHKPYDGP